MIVVDTSVWSLALRRVRPGADTPRAARLLRSLIEDGQHVALPGIVLQELLSGLKHEAQFQRLRTTLAPFPLLLASREDHERAAEIANTCRSHGVQAGACDTLIAAIAIGVDGILLSADNDFQHMQAWAHLNLQLLPAD